jgi:hypothetical protein
MKRPDLEHLIRAASAITRDLDVVVIGSASILGSHADEALPAEATRSIEAGLAFFDDPNDHNADLVDGAIGELPCSTTRSVTTLRASRSPHPGLRAAGWIACSSSRHPQRLPVVDAVWSPTTA